MNARETISMFLTRRNNNALASCGGFFEGEDVCERDITNIDPRFGVEQVLLGKRCGRRHRTNPNLEGSV